MKVTPHTKVVLARRRAVREARKNITLADIMDKLVAIERDLAEVKRIQDLERQSAFIQAVATHWKQQA
jgi:hypothetical protein